MHYPVMTEKHVADRWQVRRLVSNQLSQHLSTAEYQ